MRFGVVFVVCACAAVTLAANYAYTGDFVETKSDAPYARTSGRFVYYYDTTGFDKCRFYVEYDLKDARVKNLYQFQYDKFKGRSVLYSMCDQCSAETVTVMPDPWWSDSTVYKTSATNTYVKKNASSTGFVKSITMTGTSATDTKVSKIIFNDDRIWAISNFKYQSTISASDSRFKPASTCPTPTCGIFADLILVLDNTGSVNANEWKQQINFGVGVLNSFTFGDHAVAAAVVYFTSKGHYLATGTTTSGKSVTTNRNDLIHAMQGTRPDYKADGGLTCQGSGLELVPALFDHSPRKSQNPHRIVISVTDGQDYCRERGEKAAAKLKNTYNAFFITIGVGINAEKDRQWLKDIASRIGSSPAYYPVSDYGQIKTLVDQLFAPICDEYNPDYGKVCKGFRGCGKCFCPNCTVPSSYSDKCNPITCSARDGTSNGCVPTPKSCRQQESTKCYVYSCANGQCTETDTCGNLKKQYTYSCATVHCNPDNGNCAVALNDDFCKQKHKNNCELWQCDHDGINSGKTRDEFGCIMVENVTAKCKQQSSTCMSVTCDTEKLACVKKDLCEKNNNKCHTFTCTNGKCVDTPTAKPTNLKDDKCTKYYCNNNSGWIKDEANSWDAGKCRNSVTQLDARTCKIFSCDPNKGCVNSTDSNCKKACANIETECWKKASSTLAKCQLAKCVGETEASVHCEYETADCTKSNAAKKAKEMNDKHDGGCYSYKCSYGGCEYYEVLPRHESTACITWTCVGSQQAGWQWKSAKTTAATNCKNDICYERACDDVKGCIPVKDVCESKSTMCTQYTCNKNKTCDQKNLLMKYECMEEKCASDGTKIAVWHDDVCLKKHDCTVCSHDPSDSKTYGRCAYIPYPNGGDNCTSYTCNSTSGDTWIESPKCDDGFACTEDKCSVDGECWSVNIDCYQEINMTDYPCFRAACKEDSSQEKGYRCVRKIKPGAYMDVCGRCIETIEDSENTSSSSSKEPDLCVDEPVLPPIKEGIAAATVACIVLLALIGGGAIAGTSIIGTKILLDRARAASNQSAHSNPLFEENAAEMSNPTYAQNA